MRKQFYFWQNVSIQNKVLIPFVLIFVSTILLGTYYLIHVVSEMMETNIEKQLSHLTLTISEKLAHQEQRILFHAQNMAETKKLADQTLDTNQVRLLQIHELQALRSEKINFLGVYGAEVLSDDPLYPLVQKGLRGLRVTALIKIKDPDGISLRLIGVAPVPGKDWIREVILLETVLNKTFLHDFSKNLGAELLIFDREGAGIDGTVGDETEIRQIILEEFGETEQTTWGDSAYGILKTVEVGGTPYKSAITPLSFNYQEQGSVAIMLPTRTFTMTRNFLIRQAMIYSLSIIIAMSLLYLLIIKGITTPLKALQRASKKMIQGEPVEAVMSTSGDEVGTLARTFNDMSSTLQDREKELRVIVTEFENKTKELDSILKHMAESVVVTNQNHEIEYMNRAAVEAFGDHLGKKCYKVFHDISEPCHPCSIDEIILKKKPLYQYSTQDHEGRSFEIIAQPLRDLDGSIKVMTLRRDVTERIQRFEQEKLIQQKIQEERLTAIRQVGVSIKHGINNSLAAIFGAMELLKSKDNDLSAEEKEMVLLLESEAKKIGDIVSKLPKITDPVVTEYMDDITMIDLKKSLE